MNCLTCYRTSSDSVEWFEIFAVRATDDRGRWRSLLRLSERIYNVATSLMMDGDYYLLLSIIILILLYMKPTHETVYTMDIKRHNMCCWLIGNCRDEPLTERRKSYNRDKGKTQYKKQTKKLVMITVNI